MIPRRTMDSISGTRGFEIVRVAYRQTDAVSDVMLCLYFANACAENLDFSKVRFATCFLGATNSQPKHALRPNREYLVPDDVQRNIT